jgi:hypothetical protein
VKIKSFCISKVIGTGLERLSTEWGKFFASYVSDNGLTRRELNKTSPKNG